MKRRDFLKVSGAGLAGLSFPVPLRCLGTTRAGDGPGSILVVVYLRGGQDALNVLVPRRDPRYYELRPTIAIAANATEDAKGIIPLTEAWGMHPAMAALQPLWEAKMLAPIVNCGSPHSTRSHFDAQDFMEYGAPGLRTVRAGWLNRYLAATADRNGKDSSLRALAMQGLLPRALRGPYPVLAVPDRGARDAARYLDLFDDLYGAAGENEGQMEKRGTAPRDDDPVVASGRTTIDTLRRYQEIVGRGGAPRASGYPRGRLGDQLADIAKVIKSGEKLEVAAVDWNGWDHHAGEGGESGRMADMLRALSEAIAAFLTDLGQHARRTLVLTMTEFGRTCRENGNAGTDHGHGGVMLAVGGSIAGGRIVGRFDGLDDTQLYEGRDLPVTTDFRDVMAEIIVRHLGSKKLPKEFFPGFEPAKKGIGLIA